MGILDTVKDVVGLVQKADNIELYRQVLDLQREIMTLLDDNRALRDQLTTLRQTREIGESLVFQENQYYRVAEDKKDGPFCSLCWDSDEKLIRIMNDRRLGFWCPKRH